jgi:hypothetical protein
LEQRHAAAAARDEHGLHPSPAEERAAGLLQQRGVVIDVDAECLLDFGLVGRAGGERGVAKETVAAVHENWGGSCASPLRQHPLNG